MMGAYKKKDWAEAIKHGITLRNKYRLDWEAELRLADTFRSAKRDDEAIATYKAFVHRYPTSPFAMDAEFWMAAVYHRAGKLDDARVHKKKVAASKRSKLAGKAKKLLKKLD